MNISFELERLVNFSLKKSLIGQEDIVYARNSLLGLLNLKETYSFKENEEINEILETATEPLKNILDYCVKEAIIGDTMTDRDLMDARIMGIFVDRPSNINRNFFSLIKENKKAATDYFYNLSKDSNYIQVDRIKKNLYWLTPTEYGDLEITINLSKPEKDPKEIEKMKSLPQTNYPKCLLCKENEGFFGNFNHPARENLRLINLSLAEENWYFQYSPYVYYNEHCIVLHGEHIPMKITEKTFIRLLDFIDIAPHYFLGSNAGLPIVGGSILTHDHYQGGRHTFPMEMAKAYNEYSTKDFKNVNISLIKWPMASVRVSSSDRHELLRLTMHILGVWEGHTDEEAGIFAETNGEPHNAVTPIARKNKNGDYEIDLVFRNNLVSKEHPYGIFHPHEELHHIKKENIGLIEVMGLAVLPGRLEKELEEIEKFLIGEKDLESEQIFNKSHPLHVHADWVMKMTKNYGNKNSKEESQEILKREVGEIFLKVIADAGVFKDNKEGRAQLHKFMLKTGFVIK